MIVVIDFFFGGSLSLKMQMGAGTMRITSRSSDNSVWIVADMPDDGSPRYFLYSRADKSTVSLRFFSLFFSLFFPLRARSVRLLL